MPKKTALYNELDKLADRAAEEFKEPHIAYMLRQMATIGRTFNKKGVKELYNCVNEHCADKTVEILSP